MNNQVYVFKNDDELYIADSSDIVVQSRDNLDEEFLVITRNKQHVKLFSIEEVNLHCDAMFDLGFQVIVVF